MTNFGGPDFGYGVNPQSGYGPPPGYGYGPQPGPYGPPQPQYAYGPGAPAPVVSAPESERFSPAIQAVISALLLLPTIPIFFVNRLMLMADFATEWPEPLRNVWVLVSNAVLWVYFLVVVGFWARRKRRMAALGIAFVGMMLETAMLGASLFVPAMTSTYAQWIVQGSGVIVTVLQVAAWGVARRKNNIWTVGLIAAVVCGVALQWAYRSASAEDFASDSWWIKSWAWNIGTFVVPCLICWAVDAMARGARRAPTPQIPGR